MKKRFALQLICVSLFLSLFLCACTSTSDEPSYTLSSQQANLVQTIYNCRGIWEHHNGKSCSGIRYVSKNGSDFWLVTYAGLEEKYIILNNSMRQARLNEYGLGDHGLVTGIFSYNPYADEVSKQSSIAKAVSNRSNVIIP